MDNLESVLTELLTVKGAIASSLVDWNSGMVLGTDANKAFDIELSSAGHSEVVKSEMATMKSLELDDKIQDILITLEDQIHIIYIIPSNPDLFIYLALDESANLALARNKVKTEATRLV